MPPRCAKNSHLCGHLESAFALFQGGATDPAFHIPSLGRVVVGVIVAKLSSRKGSVSPAPGHGRKKGRYVE